LAAFSSSSVTRYCQEMPNISSPFFTVCVRGVGVGEGSGVTVTGSAAVGDGVIAGGVKGVSAPLRVGCGAGAACVAIGAAHAAHSSAMISTRMVCSSGCFEADLLPVFEIISKNYTFL
jgi:hypothetical protein